MNPLMKHLYYMLHNEFCEEAKKEQEASNQSPRIIEIDGILWVKMDKRFADTQPPECATVTAENGWTPLRTNDDTTDWFVETYGHLTIHE